MQVFTPTHAYAQMLMKYMHMYKRTSAHTRMHKYARMYMHTHADLVEEVEVGKGRVVKITGIANKGKTATVLLRGSNKLVRVGAQQSWMALIAKATCSATLSHDLSVSPSAWPPLTLDACRPLGSAGMQVHWWQFEDTKIPNLLEQPGLQCPFACAEDPHYHRKLIMRSVLASLKQPWPLLPWLSLRCGGLASCTHCALDAVAYSGMPTPQSPQLSLCSLTYSHSHVRARTCTSMHSRLRLCIVPRCWVRLSAPCTMRCA